MARIAGVELPDSSQTLYALPKIYGVGLSLAKKITQAAKVSGEKKIRDLSEEELARLQKEVEKYPVEGELRRLIASNIRRLEEIGAYRGIRHKKNLPVRGQRTRSNARTKRGKRQTIGAIRKEFRTGAASKLKTGVEEKAKK